jgi:ketosteroid isomerase-like protein
MDAKQAHEPIHDAQNLLQALVSRQLQGDAEGMAALYDPAAVLDVGNGKLAVGREAIRTFYAGLIATGAKFNGGQQKPIILNGDLALTSTRLPNGSVTAEVARRQPDGSWLWVIDQPSIAKENA